MSSSTTRSPSPTALVRASRHLFMAGETVEAEECADRAVAILEPAGDAAALAAASLHRGAILALTDEFERATGMLELARDRAAARRPRRPRGARAQLPRGRGASSAATPAACALRARQRRGRARRAPTTRSPPAATATSRSCSYREGRLGELEACIAEGLPFARERGFWSHAYNLELHRCVAASCAAATSTAALAGLRELVHGVEDPGMLFAYSVPWLGRALARRGDPAAGGLLAGDLGRARSASGCCSASRTPGLASVEWAWLAGRPEIAERVAGLARAAARAPRRRAVPGRAAALPRARRPPRRAVRRLPGAVGGRACAATGARPPTAGRRRAIPTSRRSS